MRENIFELQKLKLMIEAPEARLLSEQLNQTVKGKKITSVFTQFTPHKFTWFTGSQDEYIEWLSGKRIDSAREQGGMVEITIGDYVLVLTDGVNLRYFAPNEKLPNKHQLLIGFDDESCLIASVRMYGGLACYRKENVEGRLADYYITALSKPQVMSDAFDKEYFFRLINDESAQKKSAKAFLATEQTIPGLGNGVLQDILYNARIHPKKKISGLTAEQKKNLFYQVKQTIDDIYRRGGRNTETDLFGKNGNYVGSLSKDTAGKACPRCGETIVKENYLGGSIYYCRGCQVND